MNYIYDILLNFNEKLYDFYEWLVEDDISHVRKIPFIKVDSKTLTKIKDSKFILDFNELKGIENKTEIFGVNGVKIINYACIFCDNKTSLAVKFNKEGKSIAKSNLLLDENTEVIEYSEKSLVKTIEIKILEKDYKEEFMTRIWRDKIKYINEELINIKNNNKEKLKFLYYDCFSIKEENINNIILNIQKEMEKDYSVIDNIYDFMKKTTVNVTLIGSNNYC